jgi:peptidoglycan/xylan/chitin deacetylase (PgdA/CDA1 family)
MNKGIFKDVLLTLLVSITINILFLTISTKELKIEQPNIEEEIEEEVENQKIVYLTFDDGPSVNTLQIIEILDYFNIKATFFVVGYNINKQTETILKRLHNENHYIGLHTMSHNYYYLYEHNMAHKNFINEIIEEQRLVYDITGLDSKLIRPPYSSGKIFSNAHVAEIMNLGLSYWDWNVDTEDWKATSVNDIINSIEYSLFLLDNKDCLVVLFHELYISLKALPFVIEYFINDGYCFKAYNPNAHFPMNF